jgi:hypothetical protein
MGKTYIAFLALVLLIIAGAVWYTTTPETSQIAGGENRREQGQSVRVEARLGADVHVQGETLTVTRIVEDSRCPVDVQCIQPGTLRAEGTVVGGMGRGHVLFELGKTSTSEAHSFTLLEVRPLPRANEPLEVEDYIFLFDVTRRSAPGL